MSAPLVGVRVIVAEDHQDTRDILEQVLRDLGATVTTAATAREALDLIGAADIVVTDFSMPDRDGAWLLEQVNQQAHPIPVIALSGFAESQVPRLAQAPFARKLLKPIDPWVAGDVIREVLRGRKGQPGGEEGS